MTQKHLIFATLLVILFPGCADNNQSSGTESSYGERVTINGNATFNNRSMKSVLVNGKATLKNVTISDTLSVNGALQASYSTIGTLHTNGNAYLSKTIVQGLSSISGFLQADQSTFDEISISTRNMILVNCTTKTITVKKQMPSLEQIVDLSNTTVNGDILFEGNQGKVILRGISKVTGNITGATIEKI
ncbi:MAG: hypothetical protein Q8Q25_01775 [bacterium]|nr:hypothetical protein [bacterium]